VNDAAVRIGASNVVSSNVLPVNCIMPAVVWLASVASGLAVSGKLKMTSSAVPVLLIGSRPV
jgi:hypothetical protein